MNDVPIRPAATVMLLRDDEAGKLQVLMVKRNPKLVFGAGIWAFPGGRLEQDDHGDQPDQVERAARRAAARETEEEAGLQVDETRMKPFAHWTTPPGPPRRFATWFFYTAVDNDRAVRIDNSEIVNHWWAHPSEVLQGHSRGEVELYEPTWMSLKLIESCADVRLAKDTLSVQPCEKFCGKMVEIPEGICHLYSGDAGYESLDISTPGARRRLWARGNQWQFEDTTEPKVRSET